MPQGLPLYDSRGLIGLGREHMFPSQVYLSSPGEPGPVPDADVGLPRGDRQDCFFVLLARTALA